MTQSTPTPADPLLANMTVVFFDGECNLCNGAINFLIDHDPLRKLRYASLQSPTAKSLLEPYPQINLADFDTVIVLQDGKVYSRSTAVLRIAGVLPKPWNLAVVGFFIPRPVRDALYRLIAKNRKRLVRKTHSCRMPDPDRLTRFLD